MLWTNGLNKIIANRSGGLCRILANYTNSGRCLSSTNNQSVSYSLFALLQI